MTNTLIIRQKKGKRTQKIVLSFDSLDQSQAIKNVNVGIPEFAGDKTMFNASFDVGDISIEARADYKSAQMLMAILSPYINLNESPKAEAPPVTGEVRK